MPKRSNFVIILLIFAFAIQYNPFFSYQYMWLQYWGGSFARTLISFFAVIASLLLMNKCNVDKNNIITRLNIFLLLVFAYGTFLGLVLNDSYKYIFADGAFFLECLLYLLLFQKFSRVELEKLYCYVIFYSVGVALLSLLIFGYVREEVVVRALVGGHLVYRLTDLIAPLILVSIFTNSQLWRSKFFTAFSCIVLISVIFLGFFRSVWAALILTFVAINITYPKLISVRKLMLVSASAVFGIFMFDYIYELWTTTPHVLLGRVLAGVGSQDSLGRVTSTIEVLSQFTSNTLQALFGYGFGGMAWFINDFGEGEVYALQPVGSLSNYYVFLVYSFGVFNSILIACSLFWFIIYSRTNLNRTYAIPMLAILYYLAFQWLTFPSPTHFPIAIIVALSISLAFKQSTRNLQAEC